VSDIRQCAWLAKPRSLARSARSLTIFARIVQTAATLSQTCHADARFSGSATGPGGSKHDGTQSYER